MTQRRGGRSLGSASRSSLCTPVQAVWSDGDSQPCFFRRQDEALWGVCNAMSLARCSSLLVVLNAVGEALPQFSNMAASGLQGGPGPEKGLLQTWQQCWPASLPGSRLVLMLHSRASMCSLGSPQDKGGQP